MKNMLKKAVSLVLSMALLFSALSGCTNPDAQPDDAQSPDGKQTTLTIAAGSEPATLHPIDQTYMMTAVMCYQLYNTLFKLDEDLNAVPDLVESYEMASPTEYVLQLRQGVHFHDGTEMTAEDVKASLEYAATFPKAEQFVSTIASVEVMDTYQVKITTNEVTSKLLFDLTNPQTSILPKKLIDAGHDFNAEPVGTGPFKFVSYTQGDRIEFERNDDYFDQDHQPGMERIIWRIIPEGASRTIALESGDVDMIYNVEPVDIPTLQENPDIEVFVADSVQLSCLNFNLSIEPFDNPDFRKAIGCAIDRTSLALAGCNGLATNSISLAPMGMFGSTDEGGLDYDLDKAKEYLEKSGVDASTVTMPILVSSEANKRQAEVIMSNLGELGITVDIQTVDSAAYFAALDAKDYVAAIGSYAQRTLPAYIEFINGSSSSYAINRCFSDPEIDALIAEMNSTQDDAAREAIIQECIVKLNDIYGSVPLLQEQYVKAYRKGLAGMNVDLLGSTYYHYLYWE